MLADIELTFQIDYWKRFIIQILIETFWNRNEITRQINDALDCQLVSPMAGFVFVSGLQKRFPRSLLAAF